MISDRNYIRIILKIVSNYSIEIQKLIKNLRLIVSLDISTVASNTSLTVAFPEGIPITWINSIFKLSKYLWDISDMSAPISATPKYSAYQRADWWRQITRTRPFDLVFLQNNE